MAAIEWVGESGSARVVKDARRRFPSVLIQGDTLSALLSELEEAGVDPLIFQDLRNLLVGYEQVLEANGYDIPYLTD